MIKIGRDRLVGRETYPIICSLESLDSSKQGVTHTNSLYQTGPNKEGEGPFLIQGRKLHSPLLHFGYLREPNIVDGLILALPIIIRIFLSLMVLWLGQAASSLACIHSLLPYVANLPMSMFQQEYLGFKTHPKKNNFDFLYPYPI